MRPLFIIGNKRSGTSQLVRLLNLHPELFISHESDIVWILHQFSIQQEFKAHPWDSARGMQETLKAHRSKLNPEITPWENFKTIQLAIMDQGSPWLKAEQKPHLKWLGDKKPFQHTDPKLIEFILKHFPEARFLHIVRHPFAVVASSERFNQSKNGDFWRGISPSQKLEQWAYHEEQVWEFRKLYPTLIHTLRYEDLCQKTAHELNLVFDFLGLDADPLLLKKADQETFPALCPYRKMESSPKVLRMAQPYGYSLNNSKPSALAWAEHLFWKKIKQLK